MVKFRLGVRVIFFMSALVLGRYVFIYYKNPIARDGFGRVDLDPPSYFRIPDGRIPYPGGIFL